MARHANSIQDILDFALESADSGDFAGVDISKVETLAQNMADSLEQGIVSSSAADLNPAVSIEATTPTLIGYDDKREKALYEFSLQTDSDLFRPSLKGDGDGVNNIVALLNNGYSINNIKGAMKITGIWNGHTTKPLLNRSGAKFLQALILEYKQYIDSFEINMDL